MVHEDLERVKLPMPRAVAARLRRRGRESADWAPCVETVNGIKLNLPRHFRYHYVDREYEPLSVRFLSNHLWPGATALDVGAHIGYLTVLMARHVGEAGRVFSVEPAEDNLQYLRKNVQANELTNVTIIAAAAGSRRGVAQFHLTGSSDSHGLFDHPNTATRRVVDVPILRIDDVVGPPLDFFKIDTEGAELDTLAGMARILRDSPDAVGLVEWTPECQAMAGRRPGELVEGLRDLGFTLRVLDDAQLKVLPVDEVLADVSAGRLDGWYGNLACTREK